MQHRGATQVFHTTQVNTHTIECVIALAQEMERNRDRERHRETRETKRHGETGTRETSCNTMRHNINKMSVNKMSVNIIKCIDVLSK